MWRKLKRIGMVPIHIHSSGRVPSRFLSLDMSLRCCRTMRGVSLIFPQGSITTHPNARIHLSSLALEVVDDNHFWDVKRHGPWQAPLLVGTQFGILGLNRFENGMPPFIGTIGMSALSGCLGGFSFRKHEGGSVYNQVKG